MGELHMDFGNNPFVLGSSHSIKHFIHHPFLHPLHHWRRTACRSLWSPHHQYHRLQWGRAEPVAMRTISCIAQKIGGGRCVVIEGCHFRGILPCSTMHLELLLCLLNGNTHLFPSPARVLISIFIRRLGMISCKPCMTFRSHCIAVWVEVLMAVFVAMSLTSSNSERESTS